MRKRLSIATAASACLLAACAWDADGAWVVKGASGGLSAPGPGGSETEARRAGSPTSLVMHVFSYWVSRSEDCSDPVKVADFGDEGRVFDLFAEPTLVDLRLPKGVYRCFVTEAGDVMRFRPDASARAAHPACGDGEHAFDTYRYGEHEADADRWVALDGSRIYASGTPAEPGEDRVFYYASTAADPSVVRAAGIPVHPNQVIALASPLEVPGKATFFLDARDRVSSLGYQGRDHCWLERPVPGFR